jgi:hypothetical membrane protein
MRRDETVPWWAVASSALAPVALVGGWTVAAALQPAGYSSVRRTISELAALGARDRWLMTVALAVVGCCHVVTALGLRPARGAGRVLLALGGVAAFLVALFPLPAHGSSPWHSLAAGASFVVLSVWPLAAHLPPRGERIGRLAVPTTVSAVFLVLLGLFFTQLSGGAHAGLDERLLAGGQALWPAIVTIRATLDRKKSDFDLEIVNGG